MDDASSTYVKLCLIICSVFYLILLGSNIETNMVDVCECSMHFSATFDFIGLYHFEVIIQLSFSV